MLLGYIKKVYCRINKLVSVDMGICLSNASGEIHEKKDSQENLVYYEEKISTNEIQRLGSLYSHEGSKGLNQDAAIVYQALRRLLLYLSPVIINLDIFPFKGYGMQDGALCGVFDGHGRNGHIVSKLVRNKLPSLLLNQMNALAKVNTVGYGCNFLNHNEKVEGENLPNKDFNRWEEACINAFKVMDKEIKLIESLDCSCSGTTAVVVIRQHIAKFVIGEDLSIANLGDSRAVMGTITQEDGVLRAVQLVATRSCLEIFVSMNQ
ncbi:hypothetical protein RHGRI_031104 [Rhododendron griersonianum]|uniref:PPM-type phosphatase domain-containing protein n=1 Tax=Rhododendron griersonianum TaxID=479676 RepID=A0AAV6I6M1_9ERIC|nr:hypothetical protein RHGRI_031104 [Rhododendron griersonianum]